MATVADLYQSVLGRDPLTTNDAAGYDFWTNAFGTGPLTSSQADQFRAAAQPELSSRTAALPTSVGNVGGSPLSSPTGQSLTGSFTSPLVQSGASSILATPSQSARTADIPADAIVEKTLPEWLKPAVEPLVGSIADILNNKYVPYTAPQVAGESALQTQSWQGLAGLSVPTDTLNEAMTKLGGVYDQYLAGPSYKASDFTGPNTAREITTGLGPVGSVQSYMNPYIQGVVNVQGDEARRNAQIAQQAEAARFAKSAAFGGGRQAIAEAEQQRNLATLLNKITQEGYGTAYDKAQTQRLAEAQQYRAAQEATAVGERAQTDAALRAYQAQEAARQQQARLGLDTEATAMAADRLGLDYLAGGRGAASDIVNLQGNIQGQQLGLLSAQSQAGAVQRGITQAGLTSDFQDYMRAYEDPFKRVAAGSAAVAPLTGSSVTNYWGGTAAQPQTSVLGNAIGGAGVGIAAASNPSIWGPFQS